MQAAERAATNRSNAQFSTGPKTDEGKQASSQNAFKHGIYSRALILPTENPIEFHELRNALYAEYQPATATETVLVDELLHNAWRIRRYRRLEISALDAPHCEGGHNYKLLASVERALASSERAFHRALNTLRKLQKERIAESGFVPANRSAEPETPPAPARSEPESASPKAAPAAATGFVPAIPSQTPASARVPDTSHVDSPSHTPALADGSK